MLRSQTAGEAGCSGGQVGVKVVCADGQAGGQAVCSVSWLALLYLAGGDAVSLVGCGWFVVSWSTGWW